MYKCTCIRLKLTCKHKHFQWKRVMNATLRWQRGQRGKGLNNSNKIALPNDAEGCARASKQQAIDIEKKTRKWVGKAMTLTKGQKSQVLIETKMARIWWYEESSCQALCWKVTIVVTVLKTLQWAKKLPQLLGATLTVKRDMLMVT